MRKTLDVYYDIRSKPAYRVRLADGFTFDKVVMSGDWLTVKTEEGGEVAICLRNVDRLVVRGRSEHDERTYAEQYPERTEAADS